MVRVTLLLDETTVELLGCRRDLNVVVHARLRVELLVGQATYRLLLVLLEDEHEQRINAHGAQ